jgi:hypothetical protein
MARRGNGTYIRFVLLVAVGIALAIAGRPLAVAAGGCDVRQEILGVLLAMERYAKIAGEAYTLKRLPLRDATLARIELEVQKERAYYLCKPVLTVKGSPEQQIMELVNAQVHGYNMLLLGKSPDDPAVKAGHEAALRLIEASRRYFEAKP